MRFPSIFPIATAFISLSLLTASAAPKPEEAKSSPYFLLERVRAITDSGIVGIPVGAKLQVISKTASGFKVKTSDGIVFDVAATQITQDAAQAATNKEQAAAIEAESKAKRDAILSAHAAKVAAEGQRIQDAMDAMPSAPAPTVSTESHAALGGSSLDGGAKPANATVHTHKTPKKK